MIAINGINRHQPMQRRHAEASEGARVFGGPGASPSIPRRVGTIGLSSVGATPHVFLFSSDETRNKCRSSVRFRWVGEDGNAFAILGRVQQALVRGGAGKAEIDTYLREATSQDYNYLLQATMRWVSTF